MPSHGLSKRSNPDRYCDRVNSYSVRTAPLDQLVAELTEAADDRSSHGKHERAALAREAVAKLQAGDEAAFYEGVYYEVGDTPDRYGVHRGPMGELLAELNDAGRGYVHAGKTEHAAEAARAIAGLEKGAERVRVGNFVYEVAESLCTA